LRVSEGRGTIASGGHPLPLRLGDHGVEALGRAGTLLGAFSKFTWPETRFSMGPGETLVAITDGVTDTVGRNDERFGMVRLQEILGEAQNDSPMAIRERLVAALEDFQVGAQADDTAIVIMRFTGTPAAQEPVEKLANTEVQV
ncbi:MAG: serine/threonine-protein phosphatase, partial [Solirubrobacterales bacterium]|nr:serine/threonine-protein phosphatase [Solirubrobacterales bacterium]